MAVSTFTLLLPIIPLLLSLLLIPGPAESSVVPSTNFIKSSCRVATYPAVCVQSLSGYAKTIRQSPQQLAQTALEVSLTRTKSAQTFMKRLTKFKGLKAVQYAAIRDCLEEVEDSLDRVSKSCQEMKGVGQAKGNDFTWRMSNVQTWVSAALTDETTCMDGFAGRAMDDKIKASVRAQIVGVAHVTSNALALVNNFAAKQQHKQ